MSQISFHMWLIHLTILFASGRINEKKILMKRNYNKNEVSLIKNFKKINDFFFIKVAHHWINGLLFAEFCESLQQAGVDRFSQVIFGCLSDRNWLNNTCRNKRYSLNESWSQFRLKIWVPVIMLQARCIFLH